MPSPGSAHKHCGIHTAWPGSMRHGEAASPARAYTPLLTPISSGTISSDLLLTVEQLYKVMQLLGISMNVEAQAFLQVSVHPFLVSSNYTCQASRLVSNSGNLFCTDFCPQLQSLVSS